MARTRYTSGTRAAVTRPVTRDRKRNRSAIWAVVRPSPIACGLVLAMMVAGIAMTSAASVTRSESIQATVTATDWRDSPSLGMETGVAARGEDWGRFFFFLAIAPEWHNRHRRQGWYVLFRSTKDRAG